VAVVLYINLVIRLDRCHEIIPGPNVEKQNEEWSQKHTRNTTEAFGTPYQIAVFN
jgi:hypothetical protein